MCFITDDSDNELAGKVEQDVILEYSNRIIRLEKVLKCTNILS